MLLLLLLNILEPKLITSNPSSTSLTVRPITVFIPIEFREESCVQNARGVLHLTVENSSLVEEEEVVDEDGNPNVPSDERTVLVFQFGGQGDAKRPDDAPYGLAMGYFDHDRQYWRVHGSPSRYVTHWQNVPNDPPNSRSH